MEPAKIAVADKRGWEPQAQAGKGKLLREGSSWGWSSQPGEQQPALPAWFWEFLPTFQPSAGSTDSTGGAARVAQRGLRNGLNTTRNGRGEARTFPVCPGASGSSSITLAELCLAALSPQRGISAGSPFPGISAGAAVAVGSRWECRTCF